MGYRVRLGKAPKSKHKELRGQTREQYGEDDSPYSPDWHEQYYEIGKYIDLNAGKFRPFYDDPKIYEQWEMEFHIMTKSQLKWMITWYHRKIHAMYKGLDNGEGIDQFIKGRLRAWSPIYRKHCCPYPLDQKHVDGEIASAWDYEYAIFNLVYIYRNHDWENDYLIYSGW